MAEVFSHLMHGNLPKQIDPILQKKIDFIKSGLLKIDQNLDLLLKKLMIQGQKR